MRRKEDCFFCFFFIQMYIRFKKKMKTKNRKVTFLGCILKSHEMQISLDHVCKQQLTTCIISVLSSGHDEVYLCLSK